MANAYAKIEKQYNRQKWWRLIGRFRDGTLGIVGLIVWLVVALTVVGGEGSSSSLLKSYAVKEGRPAINSLNCLRQGEWFPQSIGPLRSVDFLTVPGHREFSIDAAGSPVERTFTLGRNLWNFGAIDTMMK
ncbi:MAG: hypothetical protein R3C02_06465 [Planctomycetaceae bacterium]